MKHKIKKYIQKILGINIITDKQKEIREQINLTNAYQQEILNAIKFNNTICDSKWLQNKKFSPGNWAVDYSFLYTLYRVLNDFKPDNIIEFGLGQSSKLIYQYTNFFKEKQAVTYEHDKEWLHFFKESTGDSISFTVKLLGLERIEYNGKESLSYAKLDDELQNEKFNLIVIDAPFGSKHYSRPQIINMVPKNLAQDFCIIMDDYNREGEVETMNEVIKQLNEHNIKYSAQIYSGIKQHFLICSDKSKFLTSL